MSRTYKDKPWKYQDPENSWDFGKVQVKYTYTTKVYKGCGEWSEETIEGVGIRYLDVKGARRKKKRRTDTEWHWMSTPMWWIREMMNQPQRAAGRQWEKKVIKVDIEDLIDVDLPSVSRKPHWYYW